MLDAEQIKATIVQRIIVASENCNSHLTAVIEGQIRALLYVLGDGSAPISLDGDIKTICDAAGIPTISHGYEFEWPKEWLIEHGFEIDEDDEDDVQHPTLGVGW